MGKGDKSRKMKRRLRQRKKQIRDKAKDGRTKQKLGPAMTPAGTGTNLPVVCISIRRVSCPDCGKTVRVGSDSRGGVITCDDCETRYRYLP